MGCSSSSCSSSVGKQSQLLLKPTEVELGLQVGVEFDKKRQLAKGGRKYCGSSGQKIEID